MKYIKSIAIIFSVMLLVSCSDESSFSDTGKYMIEEAQSMDVPATASLLSQTTDTKVKITRDVESESMNVYVISGSVEVSE